VHLLSQTPLGREQAHAAGESIRQHMDKLHGSSDYRLYFYTSPYKRGLQTYEGIR
jgi:broad specificity phosphatase PhoE